MTDREKLIEFLDYADVRDDFYSNAQIADILIDLGVTVQKWISVTERLPESAGTVIVCDVREGYVSAWEYCGEDEWIHDEKLWHTSDITHWMPLPSAPKEE